MTPEQLKLLRRKLHLSVKRMAAVIGVSWRTYQGYECGRSISGPAQHVCKLIALLPKKMLSDWIKDHPEA